MYVNDISFDLLWAKENYTPYTSVSHYTGKGGWVLKFWRNDDLTSTRSQWIVIKKGKPLLNFRAKEGVKTLPVTSRADWLIKWLTGKINAPRQKKEKNNRVSRGLRAYGKVKLISTALSNFGLPLWRVNKIYSQTQKLHISPCGKIKFIPSFSTITCAKQNRK